MYAKTDSLFLMYYTRTKLRKTLKQMTNSSKSAIQEKTLCALRVREKFLNADRRKENSTKIDQSIIYSTCPVKNNNKSVYE